MIEIIEFVNLVKWPMVALFVMLTLGNSVVNLVKILLFRRKRLPPAVVVNQRPIVGQESKCLGQYRFAPCVKKGKAVPGQVIGHVEWRPNIFGGMVGKDSYLCGEIVEGPHEPTP